MSSDEAEKTQEEMVVPDSVEDAGAENLSSGEAPSAEARLQEELSAYKAETARLEKELLETRDNFMRKAAEMDNFRKRLQRDKEEAVLYANKSILVDLVPVIDNFERAIKSSESAKDFEGLYKGIVMIESQFVSMLEAKYGLKRINPSLQPFDPAYHEAVMAEDREDHSEAMVLASFESGFVLQDKVIRTAKVKVSKPGRTSAEQKE